MNIEHLLTHLKKLTSTLSPRQIAGLVAVFVAVVSVVAGSAYWINAPNYVLLVADMDAETANSVVSRLKADEVPYRLEEGGRAVSVPAERVDELRLAFASDGLPSAGRIGFEIFDRTAFGTTEFLEHVNYRRALEGELARTIATISEVSSARVHIAMAKDSLFVDRSEPAKASVMLRLKAANRPLSPATVRGIAGLVASSVEGLRPDSVVVLDQHGRPLNKPSDDGDPAGMNAAQLDRQQQIERDLSTKVISLLEPVVGVGRVRVNVAAYLGADSVQETEERWDPNTVVRSRQTTVETGAGSAAAGGIAGARANQPPALSTSNAAGPLTDDGAATAPPSRIAAASGPGRSTETTNYEVGKLVRTTISPQGQLARLSVAVVLDDERVSAAGADGAAQASTRPWEPDGLQRIQSIVAAAVGLDPARGDQLTVENIAFDGAIEDPEPAPPGVMTQATDLVKEHWPAALRGLAIFALAAFALFGVLRPLVARIGTLAPPQALPASAPTSARLPTVGEMEGQIDAELDAMSATGESRRLPVLTQRVAKLATDEPEQVARIVRGWISEERR